MKRIISLLLCVLLVSGAADAYTVKGKVYLSGTNMPVSNASVSLTTVISGVTVQNSVITAIDGSFSIALNDITGKGNKMTLKAVKNLQSGSTSWYAQSESENKSVWVVATVNPNPNMNFTSAPVAFNRVGELKAVPVKAFMDIGEPPMMIKSFDVSISYDTSVFNAVDVIVHPLFPVFDYTIDPAMGIINVQGTNYDGVELPVGDFPVDSFFDVFVELNIPEQGVESQIEMLPESSIIDMGGVEINPVPSRSFSKLGGETPPPAVEINISDYEKWSELLFGPKTMGNIRPMYQVEWDRYMSQWNDGEIQGDKYPETTFLPPELVVYEDDGSYTDQPSPQGDGLIMSWGEDDNDTGNYSSAWVYDYGSDPDLTNCTIQVTVMPPSSGNINAVSFAMVDINNNRRSWWWSVPGQIPYNTSTTVTINTANMGYNAANPTASGFMNTPAFDITKVQSFDVDENANWVFGTQPVPPFGTQVYGMNWNYWHNLIVTKNQQVSGYKGSYVKYSQPIVEIDDPDQVRTLINGWDEVSTLNDLSNNNLPYPTNYFYPQRIMADDWECTDERPVTDIHWWGSFLGWKQPSPPRIVPEKFHIGIWTDVPANADNPWSHPGKLIWENYCDSWVWNFAGYDVDPRPEPLIDEACFQFNQLLSEDEWFYQKPMDYDDEGNAIPNIYWLSIVPIYKAEDIANIEYPWGWKTRPHKFMDDAVRIMDTDGNFPASPPAIGDHWTGGEHVYLDGGEGMEISWDLAFELTTNVPPKKRTPDLNYDGIVDVEDLAELASQWLQTAP
jgi:hypothetical protein